MTLGDITYMSGRTSMPRLCDRKVIQRVRSYCNSAEARK